MRAFAELLDRLYFTYSHLGKVELLKHYFAHTPDPDRGYAIAIISGSLDFPTFTRKMIKELMSEQIDPFLFALSYDYVGDLSETISLLWKATLPQEVKPLPSLSTLITEMKALPKTAVKSYLADLLNRSTPTQRWALLKLGTGGLRIGVSARFIKQALAKYGNKPIEEIEHIWHGLQPPYEALFAWLENKANKPDILDAIFFHPIMLAHPLEDKDLEKIASELFFVERKYDGIRVQFIATARGNGLYSRSGDEISAAFPDIASIHLPSSIVLDGELVIKKEDTVGSFNALQQRLNRKAPSKKNMVEAPAHIILYDLLMINQQDVRALSFQERRQLLEEWFRQTSPPNMSLSELLPFHTQTDIASLRTEVLANQDPSVEGLMIKRKDSAYIAGRPTGLWYKWKRDPYLVDAVLMYAQRGHGKRSSFYSDFTFGLWQEDQLLPIGKAYFGFTDAELKQLDKWIRNHTLNRFGPVREVEKALVLEIAFEAVSLSARHKSGFALRFPRIHRIRWDKPANEADILSTLKRYLNPD